jgi:hypothetical protein
MAYQGDEVNLHNELLRVMEAEDRAAQAFAATLEFAVGEVAVRWTDPLPPSSGPGGHPVTHMPVFDACYPVARDRGEPDPRWGGAHFEWSFGISELRDDRPGEVAFAAGVAVPAARATLLDDADWLDRRRARGFGRLHNVRLRTEQLLRWLDVDTVLAAGEPVAQGDLVADWVVTTFEELAADPPPG